MTYTIGQSAFAHFFTADTTTAPLWFVVRIYVGYASLMAGWSKIIHPAWFGSDAGASLQGFINGAVAKSVCASTVAASACHPSVQTWYASFLQNAVFSNAMVWSNAIAIGEFAIGFGLIVGLFTGAAAFFDFFMLLNFLLAGTVGSNPVMLVLALCIFAARRVAGYWGLDRYAMPYLRHTFRKRTL